MKRSRLALLALAVAALAALALWGFAPRSAVSLTDGFDWERVTAIELSAVMNVDGEARSAALSYVPGDEGFEPCVAALSALSGRHLAPRSGRAIGAATAVMTYQDPSAPDGWSMLSVSASGRELTVGGTRLGMSDEMSAAFFDYIRTLITQKTQY